MDLKIIVCCLVWASSQGQAQESKEAVRAAKSERATLLATMQRGKEIKGDRGTYLHVPEVQAIERDGLNEVPQQAVDRLGFGGVQVIETKGRLVLFRLAQGKPAQLERFGQAMLYPAVLNVRTKTLGVLTGVQVVKPKDMADVAAIAQSHGLETVRAFGHLSIVYYRPRGTVDIADLAAALQADSRVEKAYPEIVEHVRVAR